MRLPGDQLCVKILYGFTDNRKAENGSVLAQDRLHKSVAIP